MAKRKFRLMNFIYGILTALVVLFFVFPIFMIVVTSLKSRVDALASPPVWIFRPVFDNYVNIFSENNFDLYFRNSLIIATLGTFFALVVGVPAAYSLARFVADGKADGATVARALAFAAARAGLGRHEIEKTLHSAFRARGAA